MHGPFCIHNKHISHATYVYVSFSTSFKKCSCKKGNIQILKALVNFCCDWLNKPQVLTHCCPPTQQMPWPSPKQPRYLPNEHNALSPLFVLQQEAKSPGSTCQRDWHWANTQLEKLLAWKGLLPKWTRQTAQDGSQEHRGEVTCQSQEEPRCPSSSHGALLIHCAKLLPTRAFSKHLQK